MSFKATVFSSTALVCLASSGSADVTAQDIWSDWQAYLSGFGYTVNATETLSDGALKISDLALSVPMPEEAGNFEISMGSLEFMDNGDGTVNVVFPDMVPMTFGAKGPEGEAIKGTVNYAMQGMSMTASGDPAKVSYDYTASQIGMTLAQLIVDGDAIPADALQVAIKVNDIAGQSVMEPGALRKIAQNMTTGKTDYTINFVAPEGDGTLVLNGSMGSMNFAGETYVPAKVDPENMASALTDGFAVNGTFGYSDAASEFSFGDDAEMIRGTSSSAQSEIDVRMNKDLLSYGGSSTGVNLNMEGSELPLPIIAGFGEVAFNLLMPVSKSDTPSDFALGVTLGDFVTSDMLWMMLDPSNVLPRDPATISFDLTGKAQMLVDFFDPKQMESVEAGEVMPAELNAVTLNNLVVSAAGAELTGAGDFTFDNTDLESFDGMPKPTGGIDLKLVGGNGLMDKLVQMGLLPQEQAMMARMMTGLFARPGEGEDTLTSKIEINDEGHILANGQRFK